MNFLLGAQIIVSIILISIIQLQSKGAGLGAFGTNERSYHTKRGLEKVLFKFTIVLAFVFIAISVLALL